MRARSASMSMARARPRAPVGGRPPQPLFGSLLRGFRARDVDLLGLLGDLREDGDALRLDFGKSEGNRQVVLLLTLPVPQLAGTEDGEQRRVPRQHAEVAVGSRDFDFVDGLVDERAIGGDALQLQLRRQSRHYALCRFWNFATASSIVPTM